MIPRYQSAHRSTCALAAAFLGAIAPVIAIPNVQTFFIPFPETDFQTSLKAIDISGTPVGNQMRTVISMVVPTAGTVIRYDHWEDGYEADLNAPVQPGTQIWGDGNLSNGVAPGYPTDIFPAGATINLTNNVALPRAAGTVFYDGRDRIGSTAAIAITRAGWGVAPGTVLASACEVYDTRRYGTSYKIPIGITTGSVQNFEYSSLHIIAGSDNTTVQVDVDGNGSVDQTKVINMGESMLVNGGVKAGANVTADKPVQVHELTGDIGSTYESRTFAIRPTSLWGPSYFAPVGTTLSSEVHTVFLYNPGASSINVTYETTTSTGTISVPANGNSQFAMPMNSGGHFFTVGGEPFYAVGANDSGSAANANQTHDWGYALVPENYLTTGIVIGFGPGSDDLSAPVGPDQNGSPVWVTPSSGTTIYVNYSGDFATGPSTAPNGAKYDVSYVVNKLQSQTIYDPNDKDMTKARIFTTDGAKIAAAWGEDPSKAGPGAPYLDMGTTIVPFPQPALSKSSALVVDQNNDGKTGIGDTIEYTVRVANEGVVDLDNTVILDALPSSVTYVGGSTRVNGLTITDNVTPATIFPVDENGYTLVSIPPGGYTDVKYRVTVNPGATSVINHVTANGGSVSAPLEATTTVPIVPPGGNAPTTITFSNVSGTSVTSYPQNGNVYVTVTNSDLNTDFLTAQTIVVTVTNTITGDLESITLTETGVSTGVFQNTSPLPSSVNGGLTQQDGTLYALPGNVLTTTFINTQFGGTYTANAVIQTATQTKKLYLTDTLALDRVDPVASNDVTTASTSALGLGSSTITVVGAVATSTSTQTATTHSFSYNSGSTGSNRILMVGLSYRDNNNQTATVTYGGQAMTSVGTAQIANSTPDGRVYIYRLLNPPTGANTLLVNWSAALVQGSVVGAVTYSGVDQTTPTSTFASATGTSTTPSVTVASATGSLVFGVVGGRTANLFTPAGLWSVMPYSGQTAGAAQTAAGAASVVLSWTGTNKEWVAAGVSLNPASGGSTSVSFTQTPAFATAFTMPAGAAPSASVYYSVASGSMPASPGITATLKKGATTIATSSSVSASGGLLSFTFPALIGAANFAIGDNVTLDITNAQSGVTFTVDYDSSTKPSVVNLPTNTVIAINSFGLYDAAYPGGTLVNNVTNGQRVYARVTASDPFGAYDITSLDLAITNPSNATSTVNLTSTVASTTSTKTFEYSWLAGPNDGGYTIQATAKEGTEGINAVSSLPLQVTSLDLGTPSTTTFTDSSGNTVPSYTTSGPVYVQVVDRDQNVNTAVAETVIVVVTTSNGDRETITLTETGVNTGIFRSSAITTNTSSVTQGNNALNVVAGATLAANYVDAHDSSDTSSASAYISAPPAVAVASVFKSLISPTNGKALVGGTVSYNITVTNPGTVTLTTVSLSDSFPAANLQFSNASITPTTTGSGSLGWSNVGPLAAGQSVSLTVNFTALAAGATVTNSASVGGTATAGPSSVNVAIEKPGVTVTKTLLTPASGPVYIGDTVVWRIVVQNTGSTSLTTVPLSDNYSGGALTYVSSTVAPNSVGTGNLLWNNIGPIAVSASKTIDVTMTVKGTSNPTTNTADVSYAVDASGNAVSPSVSSASVQTIGGSIGTTIFKDMNNNGIFDSGEGIQNVYVYSDTNGNGVRDVGEPFGITDYYGAYSIYNLPVALAGTTYQIKVDTTTLPAGLTTVVVDPDATKNGQTPITLTRAALNNTTANFGYRGTASISDTVWLDVNGDGVLDLTDRRISGVKVFVDQNNNGTAEVNEPFAVTDSNGYYIITQLPNATWTVAIDTVSLPAGVSPTYDLNGISTPHKTSVVLAAGQARTDVDFGYVGSASIGSIIYNDLNGDGTRAATDPGLQGVVVFLDLNADGIRQGNEQFATTSSNGTYLISGLTAGTYAVVVDTTTLPAGVTVTGDPDVTTDGKTTVSLTSSQALTTANFGYQGNAGIGDYVWNDYNGDGIQNATESPISGVGIFIDLNANGTRDANEPFATTNSSGAYSITGLAAGSYTVAVDTTSLPAGMNQTGDPDAVMDHKTTVTLASGQLLDTADFGYQGNATVTGHLYVDTNGNGAQDSGEPDLADVDVQITDALGFVQTVITNSSGDWTAAVTPGSTIADVQESDPEFPSGGIQTEGNDPTTFTAVANTSSNGGTDGYFVPGSISGHVLADTNNDNTGDASISGVTLTLVDVNGVTILNAGNPVTATTASDGSYAFGNLPPGTYGIRESQPSGYFSVSDKDGGNLNEIRPITVAAGVANTGNDFIEEQPGSISGTVYADNGAGNVPYEGAVIHIMDEFGAPVLDGLGDPVTATTAANGTYGFGNLPPGLYCVHQDQPAGYGSVSDTDGANNNSIGDEHPIVVSAGSNNGGNNFFEVKLGVISGHVLLDTDNNGSGDSVLPGVVLNLLDGTGAPVLDGLGAPIQVASGAGGYYSFTLVTPGTYRVSQNQPAGYGSVSDVDGANNNIIGDETPIVVTPGLVVIDRDFIEIELGSIAGSVSDDTDDNGSGDAPLEGVVLTLLDGSGNPVDGDPVTSGVQPVTATSDAFGNYNFGNLFPGNYQVSETQPSGYGSVSDVDGGNLDLIGNVSAIAVAPGQNVTGRDFVEIRFGSIGGRVTENGNPLSNVTLTLLDDSGNPVDGDPGTPGIQPITTVTDSNGYYMFTNVMPGSYQVAQTQPFGYISDGDKDGGDLDIVGDQTRIVVLPGQPNSGNDFTETLDTCPDTWAEWVFQHPGETAGGNPDADAYDNFAEFAFAMPYDEGTGSPWLGSTAWIIQPSTIAPGTIEGVFVRPKGATQNVTYTLQYTALPGNPTAWQSLAITSLLITTADNGDCTETVTLHGLEGLTGLTGGKGFVRIKAELDEDNDTNIDHTSFSEVEGWKETGLELCCRTYSNPFLRESVFTGTVTGVSGQTIDFTGSADLTSVISGGSCYIEVTSGANEGQRFDVVSAAAGSLTLASDSNLFENAAPFNTVTGAPPANLTGNTIVLRRHWTLGELFPADSFGANVDPTLADMVQLFADGGWTYYWLCDDGISAPRWVKTGDNTLADQGTAVIPPGQGLYFNNRTSVTSILAYGEVRPNDFVRPLAAGRNLVSGGYPIDQSAAGLNGRAMTTALGYFGSRDLATADSFYVWKGDSAIGATGYDTWFLNNNAPRVPSVIKWVKVGDATLLQQDSEMLLLGNRSVFIRSKDGIPGHTDPNPWTP